MFLFDQIAFGKKNVISLNAVVALVYACFGVVGYLLLREPIYSMAFMTSGLAFALVMWYGTLVLPGIGIGALLFQLILALLDNPSPIHLGVYVWLSLGAMAQAALADWLVRHQLNKDICLELNDTLGSVKFFVLTGGVAVLVLPTMGSIVLSIYGIINPMEFSYCWMRWYRNEALGVVVCYPIFISILNHKSKLWAFRRSKLVGASAVVFLTALVAFYVLDLWESKLREDRLSADGHSIRNKIADEMNNNSAVLNALANFVEVLSPERLNLHDFQDFAGKLLEEHPHIADLAVADFVSDAQRNAFESFSRHMVSDASFQITEQIANGRLISATDRKYYLPLRYIAPTTAAPSVMGFDLLSEDNRRLAVEWSLSTGQFSTSAPIELVSKNQPTVGILQLVPFRSKANNFSDASISGFAVAAIQIDVFLSKIFRNNVPSALKVEVFDQRDQGNRVLIYQSQVSDERVSNQFSHVEPWLGEVDVGGRVWLIRVTPVHVDYLSIYNSQFWFFAILLAFVLLILIQVFILEVTGGGFINDQKVKETLSTLQDMLDKDLKEQVDEKAYSDLGMLAKFINFLSKENQSYTKNLENFSQAKSVFLASMSHEIRTPLNALLGTVQVLKRTTLSTEQHKMVNDLGQSGRLLLGLLNDILDFSKIEAGKMDVVRESFDIYHVLSELESYFGYLARDKGLEFVIEDPVNVQHLVIGDKLRVTQILTNLIGNAIKFTAHGHVDLRVEGQENKDGMQWIRFSIQDTGIGMDKDMQDKLFQAFTQGDGTITRRYGGTGLGLSISKKLVDLMGGKIGVESEIQQGSTFWFELPCQVDAVRDTAETLKRERRALAPETIAPELVGCRVLVVDDNEMNRVMLKRLLSQEGSHVTGVENGQRAIDVLRVSAHEFDVVLMDVQMPVLDGLSATHLIRQELKVDIPILVCSAGVYAQEQKKAMEAGADGFVSKPIERQVIIEKIKLVISNKLDLESTSVAHEWVNSQEILPARWPVIPGIDVELVKEQLGDDPEFFMGLLDLFKQNLHNILHELPGQMGVEQGGAKMLHQLRGSAGSIGAQQLVDISLQLEDAIKNNTTNTPALLADFLSRVQVLLSAIELATANPSNGALHP